MTYTISDVPVPGEAPLLVFDLNLVQAGLTVGDSASNIDVVLSTETTTANVELVNMTGYVPPANASERRQRRETSQVNIASLSKEQNESAPLQAIFRLVGSPSDGQSVCVQVDTEFDGPDPNPANGLGPVRYSYSETACRTYSVAAPMTAVIVAATVLSLMAVVAAVAVATVRRRKQQRERDAKAVGAPISAYPTMAEDVYADGDGGYRGEEGYAEPAVRKARKEAPSEPNYGDIAELPVGESTYEAQPEGQTYDNRAAVKEGTYASGEVETVYGMDGASMDDDKVYGTATFKDTDRSAAENSEMVYGLAAPAARSSEDTYANSARVSSGGGGDTYDNKADGGAGDGATYGLRETRLDAATLDSPPPEDGDVYAIATSRASLEQAVTEYPLAGAGAAAADGGTYGLHPSAAPAARGVDDTYGNTTVEGAGEGDTYDNPTKRSSSFMKRVSQRLRRSKKRESYDIAVASPQQGTTARLAVGAGALSGRGGGGGGVYGLHSELTASPRLSIDSTMEDLYNPGKMDTLDRHAFDELVDTVYGSRDGFTQETSLDAGTLDAPWSGGRRDSFAEGPESLMSVNDIEHAAALAEGSEDGDAEDPYLETDAAGEGGEGYLQTEGSGAGTTTGGRLGVRRGSTTSLLL